MDALSIGDAKKLHCYFQHHKIQIYGYIGGAKVKKFGSTAIAKSGCAQQLIVKKTKSIIKLCVHITLY